ACRRNPEDPPPGHIHHVQIARAIERRPVKKTFCWLSSAVNVDPIRAAPVNAIPIRNSREHLCFDSGRDWNHYSDLPRPGRAARTPPAMAASATFTQLANLRGR